MKLLEGIEHQGALQLLLKLATSKHKEYITSVIRRKGNDDGFITLTSLGDCRRDFKKLGLMEEQIEEGPRPKTFLVITEKGKRVAEKIREMLEILEE
jgi:predicted transcriptional regulator